MKRDMDEPEFIATCQYRTTDGGATWRELL
jgi:hypothetical protein